MEATPHGRRPDRVGAFQPVTPGRSPLRGSVPLTPTMDSQVSRAAAVAAERIPIPPGATLNVGLAPPQQGIIPTGVEGRVAEVSKDNFVIKGRVARGGEVDEGIPEGTKDNAKAEFAKLKKQLIAGILYGGDVAQVTEHDVQHIRMQVDIERRTARWFTTLERGTMHTIDLATMEGAVHDHLTKIAKMIEPHTFLKADEIVPLRSGIHGDMSAGHAFQAADLPKGSLAHNFEEYVLKDLTKALGQDPDEDDVREAFLRLSAAETYRETIIAFWDSEKKAQEKHLEELQARGAPFDEIKAESKTLRMLENKLELFEQMSLYAVQTVLTHETTVVGDDFAKAEKVREGARAQEVAGRRFGKSKPLTREQEEYADSIGSLVFTKRTDFIRYCDDRGLDFRKHRAAEQIVLGCVRDEDSVDLSGFMKGLDSKLVDRFKAAIKGAKTVIEKRADVIEDVADLVTTKSGMKQAVEAHRSEKVPAFTVPARTAAAGVQPQPGGAAVTPPPPLSPAGTPTPLAGPPLDWAAIAAQGISALPVTTRVAMGDEDGEEL